MSILEAIIFGLVQGLTEFIPVSSSGHLLLLHHWLGVDALALGYDVALHIGTLGALVLFFWRDIIQLAQALIIKNSQSSLARIVLVATLPAVVAGFLLQSYAETTFRSPRLVVVGLAVVAGLMIAAEAYSARRAKTAKIESISPRQGLTVGLAQAVALFPGVSRSGSTITAGLFMGLDRVAATRFSFLLSIPITAGAIIKTLLDGDTLAQIQADPAIFIIGIVTAFLSGIIAIRFLLRFVAKHRLNPFAYYRLALAAAVLILLAVF